MMKTQSRPQTIRDVMQEAMDRFDPKKVMAELEKERPSLDAQIKE